MGTVAFYGIPWHGSAGRVLNPLKEQVPNDHVSTFDCVAGAESLVNSGVWVFSSKGCFWGSS